MITFTYHRLDFLGTINAAFPNICYFCDSFIPWLVDVRQISPVKSMFINFLYLWVYFLSLELEEIYQYISC